MNILTCNDISENCSEYFEKTKYYRINSFLDYTFADRESEIFWENQLN